MEKKQRFIEDTFPVKEVSAEGAREKNIRKGHISTLHIWWARRPLAASRATNFAALISSVKSEVEKQKIRNFISELSKWENSNNPSVIIPAKKSILSHFKKNPPKVLDPFGGGGSIPLEALRLGCETYSNDYNPVAVLIQKCCLDFPISFGKKINKKKYYSERNWLSETKIDVFTETEEVNPLIEDLKYWAKKILNESKNALKDFYPFEKNGGVPVGFIWARTISCQNPACQVEIPLMRQYWLSKKEQKQVFLFPEKSKNSLSFKLVGGFNKFQYPDFDPEFGSVDRAVVTCPVCGSVLNDVGTRSLFKEGKSSQKLIAIVSHNENNAIINDTIDSFVETLATNKIPNSLILLFKSFDYDTNLSNFKINRKSPLVFNIVFNDFTTYCEYKISIKNNKIFISQAGKSYRLANKHDVNVFHSTESYLQKKRNEIANDWGYDPVPDEDLPLMSGVFNVPLYGIDKWCKLFNTRQLSSILTIVSLVNKIDKTQFNNDEHFKSVVSYIALATDMSIAFGNTLCRWENTSEIIKQLFGRQALPMLWDYAEYNPFSNSSGSLETGIEYYTKVIEHCSLIENNPCIITNASATKLPYSNDFFDAVFTDPPYYNSVPYADLSDFFYIWLKRMLGTQYPELFSTPLTPKANEITEMAGWDPIRYPNKDKSFFEENLKKSFQEIYRVLKFDGIATIVYAHKSTSGWETVINALLDSNLVITGSYPLFTEMQNRLRANDSATLSSSIYIIARKYKRIETGFYNDVKEELKKYLAIKLDHLWAEGITGSDFFIAAIGSGIEVFGKYEKVMDYEGNVKRADVLLDDVREIVIQYTVRQILHNGFSGDISELAKFYVLWRFSFGEAKAEFDEANKLARSVGIDLSQEWAHKGFIKKEKEFIRVLGPHNRKIDELDDSYELIDVLHHTLLLYEKGKKEEMMQLLAISGYGKSEAFFRVAQAVSESLGKLSPDSKEKKLLDGFLGGKERIKSEVVTTKIRKDQQQKLDF